jgi:glycosyltransferase involved in cell wall biosynthesis
MNEGWKITPSVFINGRFLTQPLTGVQRYCRELVSSLDRLLQEEGGAGRRWTLLRPEGAGSNLPLCAMDTLTVGGPGGHVWEQGALAYSARDGVLLSLGNSGPLCHRRHLVVIHDAAVFRTPENYSWQYAAAHRALARLLARTAHLATVSRFSQRELAELLNVHRASIALVPNGVNHVLGCQADRSILSRLGISGSKYLLCVGSPSPNKNVAGAVKAFHAVRGVRAKMVIAGGTARNIYRCSTPEIGPQVVFAGRVSDEELLALYQGATALVFPSLYEGFGIPPLEAMAQGCLVLASDIAPLREVCAGAAAYFNPFDIGGMTALFTRALIGVLCRNRLIEEGKRRIALYTWRSSAQMLRGIVDGL